MPHRAAEAEEKLPDETASRIVTYNIAHNKAFLNLDMRAYTGQGLHVLIQHVLMQHVLIQHVLIQKR